MILRLGEAGVINIQVSALVLNEIDNVFRKKSPDNLSYLALILDRSGTTVAPNPSEDFFRKCYQLIPHKGDAEIIAAAWEIMTDFFVTLDRGHFINNESLICILSYELQWLFTASN